jgi:hypothetical protein
VSGKNQLPGFEIIDFASRNSLPDSFPNNRAHVPHP